MNVLVHWLYKKSMHIQTMPLTLTISLHKKPMIWNSQQTTVYIFFHFLEGIWIASSGDRFTTPSWWMFLNSFYRRATGTSNLDDGQQKKWKTCSLINLCSGVHHVGKILLNFKCVIPLERGFIVLSPWLIV